MRLLGLRATDHSRRRPRRRRDPVSTESPRPSRRLHGISASQPRRRRDSSLRTIRVAAAAPPRPRLHGIATSQPSSPRNLHVPVHGAAATRHGLSASQPSSPGNLRVPAAAPPRRVAARPPRVERVVEELDAFGEAVLLGGLLVEAASVDVRRHARGRRDAAAADHEQPVRAPDLRRPRSGALLSVCVMARPKPRPEGRDRFRSFLQRWNAGVVLLKSIASPGPSPLGRGRAPPRPRATRFRRRLSSCRGSRGAGATSLVRRGGTRACGAARGLRGRCGWEHCRLSVRAETESALLFAGRAAWTNSSRPGGA